MVNRINRRQVLRAGALAGMGMLAAACGSNAALQDAPQPAPQEVLPTGVPAPVQSTQAPAPSPTAATQAGLPQPTATANVAAATRTEAGATAQPIAPTDVAPSGSNGLAQSMAGAATAFLAALDDGQRAKATYAFADAAERTRWHWTTPSGFPRNGLPLREMSQEQRDKALALLQSSVSEAGLTKAFNIMSLQNDLGNDPELYYATVFGTPGGDGPWGWRFEGHHYSRHFTVAGDQVTAMPFFLGAWPTVNNAGLKAMEREEWAAREIVTSLSGAQRNSAIFQRGPLSRHVTWNEPFVRPLDPVGLSIGEFNAEQQALAMEIINTYLGTLPAPVAQAHLGKLTAAGTENIRFGWAGSLEARRPHYYRLQGPTFLLEHDNSRNGGTHIHSVWRDFAEDFGQSIAA